MAATSSTVRSSPHRFPALTFLFFSLFFPGRNHSPSNPARPIPASNPRWPLDVIPSHYHARPQSPPQLHTRSYGGIVAWFSSPAHYQSIFILARCWCSHRRGVQSGRQPGRQVYGRAHHGVGTLAPPRPSSATPQPITSGSGFFTACCNWENREPSIGGLGFGRPRTKQAECPLTDPLKRP